MTFLWPQSLWLLAALPLLPVLYLWLLHRRQKAAVRYSSIATVRQAAAASQWRRHVPPALLFVSMACLLVAAARPVARVPLPWAHTKVIMAIDVSLSMRVSDVKPNRMAAAQEAAKLFLQKLPRHIEVGLVTFAGSSQVAQRATTDREALAAAIDGLQMQYGTAVGNAIVQSLAELFPDDGLDVGEMTFGSRRKSRGIDEQAKPGPKQVEPVKPGSYRAGAIVLLTDGRRTTGIDTLDAAKLAADRGVRVYVIGLGTVNGTSQYGEGMAIYLQLDEPTMREVARMTGGEYHHAATAEMLQEVYSKLGSQMAVEIRETEISGLFALAASVFAIAAGVLSMLWFRRLA